MLEQKEILQKSAQIFSQNKEIVLVTLFGSYARERASAQSDIDFLVWLHPKSRMTRKDLWKFWDKKSAHLDWSNKASLIVKKLRFPVMVETLLLDFPEDHISVFNPLGLYGSFKKAVLAWRKKNQSKRLISFSGNPYWLYTNSTKMRLDEIDFTLEIKNVA